MTDWRPLYGLAERQHRVIARRQLADLGLSESTVTKRATREGWARPYPGVWVVPGGGTDRRTIASAALAAIGPPVALSRRWAAWAHGLVGLPPSHVEVVVPHRRRATALPRIDVLRSRTLEDGDLAVASGLDVTTVARTVLDLAASSDRPVLRALLVDARQRALVELDDVVARTLRVGPVSGRGRLLRACCELAPEVVDSVLEHEVRRRLRAAGFRPDHAPTTVTTHIGPVQVDIPFTNRRVGVECDGFGYHSSPTYLDRDDRRHNALLLADWTVLRLTWRRVEEAWPSFLDELRWALERQP